MRLRRFQRAATNVTARAAAGRALILAPHPDDEVIGCGALIARKIEAGSHVSVAILTDGAATAKPANASREAKAKVREAEARRALAFLGLPSEHLHFLGFEDGKLHADALALESRIRQLIDRIEPTELYVTCRLDRHTDHQTAALAAARAVEASKSPISVLEYPVWALTAPQMIGSRQVLAVDTDPYLERKRRAFAAYESREGFGPVLELFFSDVELFLPVTTGRPKGQGSL